METPTPNPTATDPADATTVAEPTAAPKPDETQLGDPGKAALAAERRSRRDAEKQLQTALTKLAAYEDRDKTETQKLTDRAEAAEQAASQATERWRDAIKTTAIIAAATEAQAIDVDAIIALTHNTVTVSDTGEPENVEETIRELAARKPHLFRANSPGQQDATTHNTRTSLPLNSDALEAALRAAVGA